MRAWLVIGAVLLAGPAAAGPFHISPATRDPLIPQWDVARYTPDAANNGLPSYASLGRNPGDSASSSGISLGPIHAESEAINGHRRMHYRVEGLSLFGGDIGGSVGRGGGMLTLHWASPDN
jgi:hypothetical protein